MILNNCLIHKEMALKNRREMAVFGSSGGSISSQLHIVHTYDSHHTKGEPWNSLMKTVTPSF